MARSRRRAARSVAAVRQKWKVGDLVFAKVKGFPAWPAKVGELKKRGNRTDSKKVVVCFFGCEQIAFCNPVDIEEFTEEKKLSLLGKRHGKGAAFGKAVNEIIECFEKLKKEKEVGKDDDSEEDFIGNGSQSEQSSVKPMKDEAEAVCNEASNNPNCLTDTAMAPAAGMSLHHEVTQVPDSSSGFQFTEPLSTSVLSGNGTNFSQVNGCSESRKSTLRSTRTSCAGNEKLGSAQSRLRSRRSSANVSQDCHLKNRRNMKSDDSEAQAANSRDGISDDAIKENDSEIMSLESNIFSINCACTFDIDINSMGKKVSSDSEVKGAELSSTLDFQAEISIFKKRRMTIRNRHDNDSTVAAKADVVCSSAEFVNPFRASPSSSENARGKEDGDEHLPLVKRARVRMAPSLAEEGSLVQKIPEASKDIETLTMQCHGVKVGHFADLEPPVIKEDKLHSCLSRVSPVGKSHSWDCKKNSMDGEATLPPSKRIHRALEAMSVNAAECNSHNSPVVSVYSNSYYPSIKECTRPLPRKEDSVQLVNDAEKDVHSYESQLRDVSNVGTPVHDVKNIFETVNRSKTDVHCTDHEQREASECMNGADGAPEMYPVSDFPAELGVELPEAHDSAACKLAVSPKLTPTGQCKSEIPNLNNTDRKSDAGVLQTNSHLNIQGINAAAPSEVSSLIHIDNADSDSNDKCNSDGLLMENEEKAKRFESEEKLTLPSLESNSILTPIELGHNEPLFPSVACEDMDDREKLLSQFSLSLADGQDSVVTASPICSSKCSMSTTDNISVDNTISQSPYSQFRSEYFKLSDKTISREDSILAFESMVGSLTRTKDSIGRATRMAIDAAKLGLATKVVEILVCNLEREPSSHKKVNLFFLIDSITQCSRTTKGDGGVYPSTVLAMLPRLLSAAAPPGSSSHENHRQCLKVLKVWQERRILPEALICHHIRELEAFCYPAVGSRRPQRNERAFDDPVRQMEGMLVDEYGSNSSIQLPGFSMPLIRRDNDERNDSDGENSEHGGRSADVHDVERAPIAAIKKVSRILEDVDVELEMEDVAPRCEGDPILDNNAEVDSRQITNHPTGNNDERLFNRQPDDAQLAYALVDSKNYVSSQCLQNCNREFQEPASSQSVPPRGKSAPAAAHHHHRLQGNGNFEEQRHRKLPDSNSACLSPHDSHFSGRSSSSDYRRSDSFSNTRPPSSHQHSYFHEREQARRDVPPPSHYNNRYRSRNTGNSSFYRHRDRNKFAHRDNSGDWRPRYQHHSGPYYQDGGRLPHAPFAYGSGPPRESAAFPDNRWNCPPGSGNHRHVNHYSHCEDSDYWRPR